MGFQQDPWSMPGTPYRRGGGRGWHAGRNRLLWIVGVGLTALAAYTIVLTDEGLLAQRKLVQREAVLRSQIAAADARIRVLEWDNDHIETTRERRARQEYDMVRSNELIYRDGGLDSARAPSAGSAPPTTPD
jgi:cell division protein FtsB